MNFVYLTLKIEIFKQLKGKITSFFPLFTPCPPCLRARSFKIFIGFFLFLFISQNYLYSQNNQFESRYFNTTPLLVPYLENAPQINSRSAVLIDAATGTLLYSKNPNDEIPPASLTKLMTMHLMMKEIEAGRASYNDSVPITEESWALRQPPQSSLMFLEPGQFVTLREIMLGLAVSSGNDAAVASALYFAKTMNAFAAMMTAEARNMGLNVTRFTESSGISEYNMTTADEFAYFCMKYLKLHPDSTRDFHSVKTFSYPMANNVNERYRRGLVTITQTNRNNLLEKLPGVDGLKTGYIDESSYNFALTAQRENTRFISLTLGADTMYSRDLDGTKLLTWAFNNFKTVRPVVGKINNEKLWKGKENSVELKLENSTDFTSPVERSVQIRHEIIFDGPIIAPLKAETRVGYCIILDEYGELNRVPIVTAKSYEKGNIFKRIIHSIALFIARINSSPNL